MQRCSTLQAGALDGKTKESVEIWFAESPLKVTDENHCAAAVMTPPCSPTHLYLTTIACVRTTVLYHGGVIGDAAVIAANLMIWHVALLNRPLKVLSRRSWQGMTEPKMATS